MYLVVLAIDEKLTWKEHYKPVYYKIVISMCNLQKVKYYLTWASEGGQGALAPLFLKVSAKKVVFLVSCGKKQISPLWASP